MIVIRSEEEIGLIRKAGGILAAALAVLKKHARVGIETRELDRIAREEIIKQDGYPAFKGYKGYPANICTSINETVVHGIPSNRKLKDGDILSIDIGVRFRDYYADAAITLGIGRVSDRARELINVTKKALDIGIEKAVAGNRISDISRAIQEHVEKHGFSVVRVFVGHGIGQKIHEEPEIPNFGKRDSGARIEPGMVLAIEPMVNEGTFEVEILEDGWTAVTKDRRLSAHFEHTIAVRDDRAEVLTKM